jgi:hypothetical protein
MKRLFRIFDLSQNEQRVVLIVMLVLITITFVGYERRVDHSPVQQTLRAELKPSPSPIQTEGEQQSSTPP